MDLSRLGEIQITKKHVVIGSVALVVVFFLLTLLTSYFKYKTDGPITEQPLSTYDDQSFNELYAELIKDKPQGGEQKQILAELVDKTNKNSERFNSSDRNEEVYSKGTFDTLAVNCAILVEKYQELVIKYHELEKQVQQKPTVAKASRTSRSSTATGRNMASTNGFDYTKYIRTSAQNELSAESGGGGFSNRQYTWAHIALGQAQNVFNQSSVTFEVTEPFVLEGLTIAPGSKIEGIAQVNRGRGRAFISFNKLYTHDQTINIEGEVFGLDQGRGINVIIRGEGSVAEGIKREATDLVGLIDPTRTNVSRTVLQETDVGREFFAFLDAGTMALAKIRKK